MENRSILPEQDQLPAGCMEIRNANDYTEIECLHRQGWGTRKISKELGISRNTVKKYLRQDGWAPYRTPQRESRLNALSEWLREKIRQHKGNADVVRQELAKEHGIQVSLRTVERAVLPWRREMRSEVEAAIRYETEPGRQMQIDFGQKKMFIGDEWTRVHLFTATLGYSRRQYVQAFRNENQAAWFDGIEAAFLYFGGVPQEVLVDNAKSLVTRNDKSSGELFLNEKFKALSSYWGFRIKACAPRRPRTKGKVERYVGYGKNNCMAGRSFSSWKEMEGHIAAWLRDVADTHVVSTTGESPLCRFEREERAALSPLEYRAPFLQIREYVRKVSRDCVVELDTNHYSVPWGHIGEQVRVSVEGGEVIIRSVLDGDELTRHAESRERHSRIERPEHLKDIIRVSGVKCSAAVTSTLSRPLSAYEEAVNVA